MTSLEKRLFDLQNARDIIEKARCPFAGGNNHDLWTFLYHADKYLEKQSKQIIKDMLYGAAPWYVQIFKR